MKSKPLLTTRSLSASNSLAGELDVNGALTFGAAIDRLGFENGHFEEGRGTPAVAFHDFAGNLDELQLDAELLLERRSGEPEIHLEFPGKAVAFAASGGRDGFCHDRGLLAGKYRVDAIDVAEGAALATMDERRRRIGQHFSLEKLQNDPAVLFVRALKGVFLPPLAFVAAEIVHVEGSVGLLFRVKVPLKINEALTACMDAKPAEIGHNPAAAKPLGHCAGCTGTAEKVCHQISLLGGGGDDPLQKRFWFLSVVPGVFECLRIYWRNIRPHCPDRDARHFVEKASQLRSAVRPLRQFDPTIRKQPLHGW